jgi:hypothetical protein
MIRRVNAVLGWEASKEINSRGRGDARKNGRASAGVTYRLTCPQSALAGLHQLLFSK